MYGLLVLVFVFFFKARNMTSLSKIDSPLVKEKNFKYLIEHLSLMSTKHKLTGTQLHLSIRRPPWDISELAIKTLSCKSYWLIIGLYGSSLVPLVIKIFSI